MSKPRSRGPGGTRVANRFWVRSVPVKTLYRPAEAADLEAIAEAWGVPVATAVWAIVVEQLARWRRQAPELGEAGLAIAAAATVLRQKRIKDSSGRPEGHRLEHQ